MMRRAALLAVMILAILAGAATTATAATGTRPAVDLPAICAEPPTAEGNSDTVTGGLDVFAPDRPAGVPLHWQRWRLDSPLLDRLTEAVRSAAGRHLGRAGGE